MQKRSAVALVASAESVSYGHAIYGGLHSPEVKLLQLPQLPKADRDAAELVVGGNNALWSRQLIPFSLPSPPLLFFPIYSLPPFSLLEPLWQLLYLLFF